MPQFEHHRFNNLNCYCEDGLRSKAPSVNGLEIPKILIICDTDKKVRIKEGL